MKVVLVSHSDIGGGAAIASYRLHSALGDFGIDLGEFSGQDHRNLPVPAVFIVSTDGIIQFQYVNPDYKVRLKADTLIAAARSVKRRHATSK